MCNLYTATKSATEVAALFKAQVPLPFNIPSDILPGRPGMVVREQEGGRILQSMVWGFPLRLKSMKPGSKPKPVNNIAARQADRHCGADHFFIRFSEQGIAGPLSVETRYRRSRHLRPGPRHPAIRVLPATSERA